MKQVKILLDTPEKIKEFVNQTCKFDADFDLGHGRYIVDGKSIMGIFSLLLNEPIELTIRENNNSIDMILVALKSFIVE